MKPRLVSIDLESNYQLHFQGLDTIIAPIYVVPYMQNFVKWQYRSYESSSKENRNTTRHDFQSFAPKIMVFAGGPPSNFLATRTFDVFCGTLLRPAGSWQ